MIKRDGHYILTVDDWNIIVKFFMLNSRTVNVKEAPDLLFTAYKVYDIYSKKVLFVFYDHDGKIRVPGPNNTIAHEIDISKILTKNPDMPSQKILSAIAANCHNHHMVTAKQVVRNIKDNVVKNTSAKTKKTTTN